MPPEVVAIFCDESCHLQNDHQTSMALGAIWVPHQNVQAMSSDLRKLKSEHGLGEVFELKWSKSLALEGRFLPGRIMIIGFFASNEQLLEFLAAQAREGRRRHLQRHFLVMRTVKRSLLWGEAVDELPPPTVQRRPRTLAR